MPDLLGKALGFLIHFGQLLFRARLFGLDLCEQLLPMVALDVQDPLDLRGLRLQRRRVGLFLVQLLPDLFRLLLLPLHGTDQGSEEQEHGGGAQGPGEAAAWGG